MISKTKILFAVLLFPLFLHASESVKYATELKLGTTFINSGGLNKITQGTNSVYGTDFSNVRMPLVFSGTFYLEFFNSRIGAEIGYEYVNKFSYSSLYDITESIYYGAIPVSLNYQYRFLNRGRYSLLAGTYIGFMNVTMSMSTDPAIVEQQSYNMVSTAFMLGTGLDFLTRISTHFRLSSSLYYRYASTQGFTYSGDTLRHNNGEKVLLSNGEALTMNLSGIRFLIGIILEWS
jgi:hypothetical protein